MVSCLLAAQAFFAQTTSLLSGTVRDASSAAPLEGASVNVVLPDTTLTTTTDAQGRYRLIAVPTGIHAVRFSAAGTIGKVIPEVWIRLGREEILDVALESEGRSLGELSITGAVARPMSVLGTHALTVEQSLRYPATFFDPVRLAATYPGVASTNDQANHLSVRGNGPASNAWLLEGAEIVTPNHLTNAGTASDLPTLNGGGTNILSAQLLGTSQLMTGGFATEYGNAMGGLLDMHLRRGNNERQAFTLQAGLLGIDLSTEGPFRAGGQSSYLVNYRYSTVGLLSAMGVDLGEETITFQDLSFHVTLPMKGRGLIALFGLGGNSSNTFEAKADTSEREFDKDGRNITYNGMMGAVGATLRLPISAKAVWRTTIAFSQNDQDREEEQLSDASEILATNTVALSERKLSFVTSLRGGWGGRATYQVGGSAMERTTTRTFGLDERTAGWLMRPYAKLAYSLTERLLVEGGAAYAHWTYNASSVVEPRLALRWRMRNERSLALAGGQRSQLPNVQLYRVGSSSTAIDNTRIGLTRMQDITLAYDHPIRPHLVFHAEVFHQRISDIAVGNIGTTSSAYDDGSLVNAWDNPLLMPLQPTGTATNSGVELSFQHTFHRNLFYQINATGLQAVYTDSAGRERDSRWNNQGIANVVIGREFVKQQDGRKRTWGVNGRVNAMGGMRTTPIDVEASRAAGTTLYRADRPMAEQLPMFYRIDVRVYLKRERKGHTGMWAIDLQNLTNAENVAFRYFDVRKDEVVTKYQLGLIPNLSYRIEF